MNIVIVSGALITTPIIRATEYLFFIASRNPVTGDVHYVKCKMFDKTEMVKTFKEIGKGSIVSASGTLKTEITSSRSIANYVDVERLEILSKPTNIGGMGVDEFIRIWSPGAIKNSATIIQNKANEIIEKLMEEENKKGEEK